MDRSDQTRKFLWVLILAVVPFAAAITLCLTWISGPSDVGVRCTREPGVGGRCEVLQSRLLGFAGNSSFFIPEADISGARAVCPRGVGGRGGSSCSVDLLLKSGPYRFYPVLSYPLIGQARSSAGKLNGYFTDRAQSSIVMQDEIGTTILIVGGLPLLMVVVLLVARRRRRTL